MLIKGFEVLVPPLWDPPGADFKAQEEKLIEKCLDCFEAEICSEGKYAFLEASDAVGRTTALMCSSLAWLLHKSQGKSAGKVLFLCGNSTECQRRVKEFENTDYSKLGLVTMMLLDVPEKIEIFDGDNMTDESKYQKPQIVFTTQCYFFRGLLSTLFRLQNDSDGEKNNSLTLQDTIIIMDDSHLLAEHCRYSASHCISLCKTSAAMKELEMESDHEDVCKLREFSKFFNVSYKGDDYEAGVLSGSEIKKRFNHFHHHFLKMDWKSKLAMSNDVFEFIGHIFQFSEEEYFKMFVTEDDSEEHHIETCQSRSECRVLKLLCVDPIIMMKRLLNLDPGTVIFSSTTILPITLLKDELGIPEAVQYELSPTFEDFKIFARIVSCGAAGYYLNSADHCRKDADYLSSIGQTVMEFIKLTPPGKGLIVYFTSNELMGMCIDHWKNLSSKDRRGTLWENMREYKDIFSVHSMVDEVSSDSIKYCNLTARLEANQTSNGKGICMMAVLRGQVSEDPNIHFDHRRVVIIVGLPFLPPSDPAVKFQKTFDVRLESKRTLAPTYLSYSPSKREAYKAINRVISRQIDAISDHHGVVLLCDMRYEAKYLPSWISERIPEEKRFKELLMELKDFYEHIDQRVQWFSEKYDDPFSSTQFGAVQQWEFEKVQLEYNKFKKSNYRLELNRQFLKGELKALKAEKEELEKKLEDLRIIERTTILLKKENQTDSTSSGDGRNEGEIEPRVKQEPEQMIVSPSSIIHQSPRKRPYPGDTQ